MDTRELSLIRCLIRTIRLAYSSAPTLLIGALAAQTIASLGVPAQLLILRELVNAVIDDRPRGALVPLVALLISAVIVQRLGGLVMGSFVTLLRQHASAHAVADYLHKAATIDAGYLNDATFHDRMRNAGEAADDRIDSLLFATVGLWGATVSLIGLTSVLASISLPVAGLVVGSMVPWVLAEQFGFQVVRRARYALVGRRREQTYLRQLVTDSDSAAELLASGSGSKIATRYAVGADELLRLERPAHVRQFGIIATGNTIGGIILAVAFGWAAFSATAGDATAGDIAATLAALAGFQGTTGNFANTISMALHDAPYLRDYFAFLRTPPLLPVPATPAALPKRLDGVVFDRVSYSYPNVDTPALQDVSLHIAPGELLALVGENGAGKSTLVKLLLRFFDPDQGTVRIGGIDLRDCDPREVRTRIGVLFQDFARYQFTIRDVVDMGGTDARTDERVAIAIRAAGLDGFVSSLPDGLDTRIGRLFPGGRDLSGGQWQRLALARLFYRDAQVLVLDEPTSALDPEAEEATFAQLRTSLGDRVGIVISHRFSTVRTADRIGVLHQGRLVELGTHDELLAARGRYAELFELQAANYR